MKASIVESSNRSLENIVNQSINLTIVDMMNILNIACMVTIANVVNILNIASMVTIATIVNIVNTANQSITRSTINRATPKLRGRREPDDHRDPEATALWTPRSTSITDCGNAGRHGRREAGVTMGLLKNDHPERTLAADGSGSLRLRRQIHAAWGEHVRSYEWDWVATLTPRFADYAAGSLQREFVEGFVRRLSWREGAAVPWFAVTERGAGNVMHIHAMLAAKAVSIEDVRACWNVGISDVSPYDHNGNMALYLSKTLASPASSFERWNSSLTMPRRRAMNPGGPPLVVETTTP